MLVLVLLWRPCAIVRKHIPGACAGRPGKRMEGEDVGRPRWTGKQGEDVHA